MVGGAVDSSFQKKASQPCIFYDDYFGIGGWLNNQVQEAREWSEKILPNLPLLYFFLENERKEKNSPSINAPVQNGPALATEVPTLSEASKHSAAGPTLSEALQIIPLQRILSNFPSS